jgi:hypothetical protein
MRHAARYAWIAAAAATAMAVAASCIPDFEFAKRPAGQGGAGAGGAGGAGGQGAGGQGAGGQGAGGEAGAGPAGPTVPCSVNAGAPECAPGYRCCFHKTIAACDMCTEANTCEGTDACAGSDVYAIFRCNTKEDCPSGFQCCLRFNADTTILDTSCSDVCAPAPEQYVMCSDAFDCPPSMQNCRDFVDPYPGYKYCSN